MYFEKVMPCAALKADVLSCLAFMLFVLASCSIKEDRASCPCWLTFDLSGAGLGMLQESGATRLYWSAQWEGGEADSLLPLDSGMESIVVTVPRTDVSLALSCGGFEACEPSFGMRIPDGCDCPAIFTFASNADTCVDELEVEAVLHKNYCVMDISLCDQYRAGAEYVIRGDVAGYDSSWRPVFGTFSFTLAPDDRGRCRVSLPRQIDNSLKLCVFRYGELEKIFAVGEYVADSGYDWNATDLDDLSLEIDYSQTAATFKIDQWKKTLTFNVVI